MKMIVLVKLNEYERIDENKLRKIQSIDENELWIYNSWRWIMNDRWKMNYEFTIREGELWMTDEMNYEFTIREGELWMTDEMN